MKTKICSQSNMCVNVANWTHSVRETLHRGDWQDQLISVSHGGSMTTVIWRWLIAEQHGNVYSHLPSDSHTHPASIKPTVRPHPIIPEPASSLTSHYKTLRHLGEGELHSFMNRFVLVCSLLWVYLLHFSCRWRLYRPRTLSLPLLSLSQRAVLNL